MMEGDSLLPLHTDALRVAIVAENFLPKIDGSTITLAHLLQHLHSTGIRAMLLGPKTGMTSYAGASLFGTFGVPSNSPRTSSTSSTPSGSASRASLRSPLVPELAHRDEPPYRPPDVRDRVRAPVPLPHVGYACGSGFFCTIHARPEPDTVSLLAEKGLGNLRVVGLGVDHAVFHVRAFFALYSFALDNVRMELFPLASPPIRGSCSALLSTLPFADVDAPRTHLIFVGDGRFRASLQALCVKLGVPAIFTRQLTDRRLTEAFTSGDVIRLLLAENGGSTDGGDALFSRITIL
ncbi:hypothetical protein K438DRAFT_1976652 [Mycena galopus ATCC 62051]|nr:hypothetical protein K438DRAFT_1976652 [Mycena galopus ATCC 62051]